MGKNIIKASNIKVYLMVDIRILNYKSNAFG